MPAQSAVSGQPADAIGQAERWFLRQGLPYFVPTQRQAARDALRPRRTVPLLVAVSLAAVGLAVLLAWLSGRPSMGAATLTFLGLAAGSAYAVTALRARPIVVWALRHTLGSLRQLLPTVTRSLPLLIVFVTFLFINGEVWHVASHLDGGVLWLVVLLFLAMGIGFFLVRLPEEIDRADDELDDARTVAVVEGTPLAADAERLAAQRPGLLVEETRISRFERVNLTVALVVIQLSQVLLVSLTLMAFLILFGGIAMHDEVVEVWIGEGTHHPERLPNLSVELFQVAVFLSAFSALYISVTAVTDDAYRSQFFAGVMREMERAIAMRAAYNALRKDRGEVLEDDPAATPVQPLDRATAGQPAAPRPSAQQADPDPTMPPGDPDATMPLRPVPPHQDRP